ncbi:MFS transporter [Kibdelosporangium persicum]|uniref:Spectinomycin tetracycline efflux pump n=1 Tax=Kibdelosporangium persicum TaxID=2698649 RepID=A0ABX2FIU7_9PSEU|nr:MFS transporter [Kibdelosporangium persicum]NRN70635.1 Spectinomycin tetracycline efflux pump [Kibdelosporangium persicum]
MVLALACVAQFMVVLDVSIVNVALPSIQRVLGLGESGPQWVVNAYALVFAGFLLLGGRLADLYGLRRVFLSGLVLFGGASLAGGLADDAGLLIAARAAQGLGAAILAPATVTALTTTFREGPERTRALAIWTAVGLAGGTAGNLIGGVLTEYLSWRSTLLINVPLCALAVPLVLRGLAPAPVRRTRSRLDLPGAVLATSGLAALAYGFAHNPAALAIGVAALASFVVVEARSTAVPLFPLRLLRSPAIRVGNIAMLLAGACLNPMWYFLTLTMQNLLHYPALLTGLGFLPHTVVSIAVGMFLTPRLMRHVDSRILVSVGALIGAAGFWWQSRISPDSDYLSGILGPAVIISFGGGLLNTPITTIVTSGVNAADAGAASGLMNTTKQIGGALGLAVLVTATDTYAEAFLAIGAVLVVVAIFGRVLPARRCDEKA